jgi:hypothetical protein
MLPTSKSLCALVFLLSTFAAKASNNPNDKELYQKFYSPLKKQLQQEICICSGTMMLGGYQLNLTLAYNSAPGLDCSSPSYCAPGAATDAYLLGSITIWGAPDMEFETTTVSDAAFESLCGPCYFSRMNSNNTSQPKK